MKNSRWAVLPILLVAAFFISVPVQASEDFSSITLPKTINGQTYTNYFRATNWVGYNWVVFFNPMASTTVDAAGTLGAVGTFGSLGTTDSAGLGFSSTSPGVYIAAAASSSAQIGYQCTLGSGYTDCGAEQFGQQSLPIYGHNFETSYNYVDFWNNTDTNTSTHIIRIVSPPLYSTTTSPIPIEFDIFAASSSPPMGYDITFVNSLTFESHFVSGWLVDTGFSSSNYNTVYRVSTSTPLSGDGTWKMTIALWSGGNGGPEPDPTGTEYRYFGTAPTSWFGLNFNDNVSHVVFPPYATFLGYASTSCDLNFSGTFSVSGCAGYLFYPSQDTLNAYPSLYAQIQEKLPFSYLFSIANTWEALVASTTANLPTYAYNLHDLGIGSTSPIGNLMPNFNGLSSTTVGYYLNPTLLALLKALASAALILGLFADIFFTVRNMMRH